MLISTVIYIDGQERQYPAESLSVGHPHAHFVRIDLADRGELIISMSAIREIHTQELPENAISPEIFGSPRP